MTAISKTAFYCCGARMQDAEAATSVCGDSYANLFMEAEGLRIFNAFKAEHLPNAGVVARHRIVDDLLREALAENPETNIVLIGAGFDTRAYRLAGGHWFELDEPAIITYKEARLPTADCRNPLQRIAIDFSSDSLKDKLAPLAQIAPVIVVLEGVVLYLEPIAIAHMLNTLRDLFPRHRLVCDLMTRRFFERYTRPMHEKLVALGASFKFLLDAPEQVFHRAGYLHRARISILEKTTKYAASRLRYLVFKLFLAPFNRGYSIWVFER